MVLIILKHISQWEGLSHILWKKKYLKPPTRLYICMLYIHFPILILYFLRGAAHGGVSFK